MSTLQPCIPAFLLRQSPLPKYMVTDDDALIITAGDQMITLEKSDLARLRAFFNKFDIDLGDHHAHA